VTIDRKAAVGRNNTNKVNQNPMMLTYVCMTAIIKELPHHGISLLKNCWFLLRLNVKLGLLELREKEGMRFT
jgi:hypothetical protein